MSELLDYVLGDGGSEADAMAWLLADAERLPEAYELLADLETIEAELAPERVEEKRGAAARLDRLLLALADRFAEEDAALAPVATTAPPRRPAWLVLAAAAGVLVAASLWLTLSRSSDLLPTHVEVERNQTLGSEPVVVEGAASIVVDAAATLRVRLDVPSTPRRVGVSADTWSAPLEAAFPDGGDDWTERLGPPGATARRTAGVVEVVLPVRALRAGPGQVRVNITVDGARARPLSIQVR